MLNYDTNCPVGKYVYRIHILPPRLIYWICIRYTQNTYLTYLSHLITVETLNYWNLYNAVGWQRLQKWWMMMMTQYYYVLLIDTLTLNSKHQNIEMTFKVNLGVFWVWEREWVAMCHASLLYQMTLVRVSVGAVFSAVYRGLLLQCE